MSNASSHDESTSGHSIASVASSVEDQKLEVDDFTGMIGPFPITHRACDETIRSMVRRVEDHTATAADLVSLAVLLQASAERAAPPTSLEPAIAVWQSRSSLDMDLRENILGYLCSDQPISAIVAGLVLLRLLLTIKKPYSNQYLKTTACVQHLRPLATKYQATSVEANNLLLDIYDLVATEEPRSMKGLMNTLLDGDNTTYALQMGLRIVRNHADFVAENASGLQVLTSRGIRNPDVRVRQHLYPLLAAVHKQSPSTYNGLASQMSEGQRKFVNYYLEVSS